MSHTVRDLALRFNLSEEEVIAAVEAVKPIASKGKKLLYGDDAVRVLRSRMLSGTIKGVGPQPEVES